MFVFLFFGFECADKSCRLENERYKVVYDKQFSDWVEWELVVIDQTLIELKNSQKSEYKIDWIAENQFRLTPISKQTNSLTSIQEKLNSLGEPYYKITGCRTGNISFEFRRNAHILINSGKLIRND